MSATSKTALSFGGGVQSNAILVLVANGRLPKPDVLVIADTGYEISTTWEYFDAYGRPLAEKLGIEVLKVNRRETKLKQERVSPFVPYQEPGSKKGDDNPKRRKMIMMPVFTHTNGETGKGRPWCSVAWKRDVITHALYHAHPKVKQWTQWIGFSTDEMHRARKAAPRGKKWRVEYPLIKAGVSRSQCVQAVKDFGWPTPPRSSCYHCPNHTNAEWRHIRDDLPGEWHAALRFEELMNAEMDEYLDCDFISLHRTGLLKNADLEDGNSEKKQGQLGFCESGNCFT